MIWRFLRYHDWVESSLGTNQMMLQGAGWTSFWYPQSDLEDGLQASKLLLPEISQIIVQFYFDLRLLIGVLNLLGFWTVGYQTIPSRNSFINVGHLISNQVREDLCSKINLRD